MQSLTPETEAGGIARVYWAVMLARDLDTCRALVRGEPVDPARLHPEWVETAAHFELVRLDLSAIDVLDRRAELRALVREAA